MNIDCDGVDFKCPYDPHDCGSNSRGGDGSSQPQTDFGALDARVVPWIVIPNQAFQSQKIPPNAVSAAVCNGKIFYGIMGDTNGANPETIGEASLLMGETCFPNDHLSGGTGHDGVDVLCNNPAQPPAGR
jgi:chitosanase